MHFESPFQKYDYNANQVGHVKENIGEVEDEREESIKGYYNDEAKDAFHGLGGLGVVGDAGNSFLNHKDLNNRPQQPCALLVFYDMI